tara:strand:+ start:1099 stop:1599 length:501 start_codon:yes stop_codon:yes gene_type:complete
MNFRNKINDYKILLFKKENILFLTISLIVFTLDRISKNKILKDYNDQNYFINDFLNIDLVWNIGIGFGLLSTDSTLLYNLVTILIGFVIVILFNFLILSKNIDKLIYSIIIGGALGNLYDRIIYKSVPDFIDLHYNNFHWFVFNVADIFITLGIVALLIYGSIKES